MILQDILKTLQENQVDSKINTKDYTQDYFTFHKDRFEFIIKKLEQYYKPGKSFLDIGSLRGYMMIAASLIGYKVAGVDLDKFVEEIRTMCEKYNFINVALNLETDNLSFPDNSFDIILFSEVLEHLNFHPGHVFLEISRVLKKGGIVITTTPNLSRLNNIVKLILNQSINAELDRTFTDGTHYREYTSGEIEYLMKEANLKNIQVQYLNFKYPNLGKKVRISDLLSNFLPSKKRDLCVIGEK